MNEFRKVKVVDLDYFKLKLLKENSTNKNMNELIEYYDKYILQQQKAEINSLKRIIYTLMYRYQKLENKEKSQEYYHLYQCLKNNKITYREALSEFMKIE